METSFCLAGCVERGLLGTGRVGRLQGAGLLYSVSLSDPGVDSVRGLGEWVQQLPPIIMSDVEYKQNATLIPECKV